MPQGYVSTRARGLVSQNKISASRCKDIGSTGNFFLVDNIVRPSNFEAFACMRFGPAVLVLSLGNRESRKSWQGCYDMMMRLFIGDANILWRSFDCNSSCAPVGCCRGRFTLSCYSITGGIQWVGINSRESTRAHVITGSNIRVTVWLGNISLRRSGTLTAGVGKRERLQAT